MTVEQVGTDDQSWVLDAGDGVRTGLSRDRVRIGGGPDDDVVMRDWPEGALELVAMPTGWVGCVGAEGTVSARPVEAGQVVALDSGDRLCFAATSLTLLSLHGERVASTHLHEDEGLPREVTLAFLPTGGRLTLRFLDKTVTLTLSELRASLVAALLTPRAAAPGEPVEDDELLTRIWPGQSKRGRLDLNQLLHRTRRDLTQAGADGPRLLLRAVTGGATTFQLSKNAAVSVS